MTSMAEGRPCFIPEAWLLSHLHVPRIDQAHVLCSEIRGTLLIRLDPMQNKQGFWSWRCSRVVHCTVFFNISYLLACGLKSLLSAVLLFVQSKGMWLWKLQGTGDDPVVHELSWLFCPLFFHCGGCLEFFKGLPIVSGLAILKQLFCERCMTSLDLLSFNSTNMVQAVLKPL